jgi:predicted dinucleotide-binding enzyme
MNESLMERLQLLAPGACFVKAFSCVGSPFMVNPRFPGGRPTMFICGNDEGAKRRVTEVLERFGWEAQDMGRVAAARAIEPLAMLWCIPGLRSNQWTHAFKLLRM